jgi:hypothetical protein
MTLQERDQRLLERVGEALFGTRWQSDLGRALDVNLRTTRRWASGKSRIAPEYWYGMKKLLDRHAGRLGDVQESLDRKIDKITA